MNKTFVISLIVIGGIVLAGLILGAGLYWGRTNTGAAAFGPFTMMGNGYPNQGYSMWGNGRTMMGGSGIYGGNTSGGAAYGKPLTADQAKQAVESYLARLNNSDLVIEEIMIFDNNAYALIAEKSTGIGAMELLVDPVNLSVFPEYGPNMMWNLKYGHMGGTGGMMAPAPGAGVGGYGRFGYQSANPGSAAATMTISPDQARKIAQQYLDQQYPGTNADPNPDPFYGYYTLDFEKDGKPVGMLSVNGFNGQVFLHTWHGAYITTLE